MNNVKLLLVEDNPVLARMIPLQLTKYGCEVVGVTDNGEEALSRFSATPVDLVLMDIDLGGTLDGVATAEAIQKLQEVPVIFITSHSGLEIKARIKAVKSAYCLSKPFTEREIALTIELGLLQRRYEKERAAWEKQVQELRSEITPLTTDPRPA